MHSETSVVWGILYDSTQSDKSALLYSSSKPVGLLNAGIRDGDIISFTFDYESGSLYYSLNAAMDNICEILRIDKSNAVNVSEYMFFCAFTEDCELELMGEHPLVIRELLESSELPKICDKNHKIIKRSFKKSGNNHGLQNVIQCNGCKREMLLQNRLPAYCCLECPLTICFCCSISKGLFVRNSENSCASIETTSMELRLQENPFRYLEETNPILQKGYDEFSDLMRNEVYSFIAYCSTGKVL
jgi:hypothetical protein